MRPFAYTYARPQETADDVTEPYTYDPARQLNVLPDGRPAIADLALLAAAGTTTSKAGSQTHFDD
ncbi:putative ATP-grasp-modified RiPP [Streptomyces sp. NPDC093595]|jgi:putative ATP-grasp target RiPP|uniref:putative ATP-grasp-modified RiPP n=1 Tax=unclassified Streptomyces TaxID=2593676 RepID=UPI0004CA3C3C|nr:putative ATP-grasp-modified RiPP [Streptomyces sp. NRRL S-118]